jgi:hypothetical protein
MNRSNGYGTHQNMSISRNHFMYVIDNKTRPQSSSLIESGVLLWTDGRMAFVDGEIGG